MEKRRDFQAFSSSAKAPDHEENINATEAEKHPPTAYFRSSSPTATHTLTTPPPPAPPPPRSRPPPPPAFTRDLRGGFPRRSAHAARERKRAGSGACTDPAERDLPRARAR